MNEILASCNAAADYPKNLIRSNTYAFIAQSYFDRLNERQNELFNSPEKAALDFWESGGSASAFWSHTIRTPDALKTHLCLEETDWRRDPNCRFIFVQAPHSRERLNTTRYMLALLLTYQQVIPGFLDFLFLFGKQVNERGFHFAGFRYQSRLSDSEWGLGVSELGWSGRDYKLCFNLRSVEPARGGGEPWSIRQAAIHHSFDVVSGQASWIIIKANKVLQERIRSATGPQGMSKVSSYRNPDSAFASTLATHVIFCQWSGENWRWYIDYLEETLQQTTERTLSPTFLTSTRPNADPNWSPKRHLTYADALEMSDLARGRQPPQPKNTATSMCDSSNILASVGGPKFSFMDLQRTQHLEEKAPAAALILKTVVTLCFLPGTFISTLMSTDIIKFQNEETGPFMGSFSLGALGFYLIISVPLVAFTLLMWWIFYRREIRQRDQPSGQERPGQWVGRWRSLHSRLRRSCPSLLPT